MVDKADTEQNPIEDIFVARQPIFDNERNVFAYELLFRSGFQNFCDNDDGNYTTSKVITNSFLTIGIDSITSGKRAFINFPRKLLVDEIATSFSRELMGVEILETVEPDDEVIRACKTLRESGYVIALDDFVLDDQYARLSKMADIIKIDFLATPPEERQNVVKEIGRPGLKFLAEKVETNDDFLQGVEFGYSYFQGYFFSKPVIISGRDIPGYKVTFLRILQEISKPDIEFDQLENIIKQDVSLTYKLLRYINSAIYGFNDKIHSIKHALVLLGINEIRKWLALILLSDLGKDKPQELIVTSVIRAKFCELLAPRVGKGEEVSNLFLLGLFSLIDAFLDRPLKDILEELPIDETVKKALSGESNQYRDLLELVTAYEKGDWEQIANSTDKLNLLDANIPRLYALSIKWAQSIFKITA